MIYLKGRVREIERERASICTLANSTNGHNSWPAVGQVVARTQDPGALFASPIQVTGVSGPGSSFATFSGQYQGTTLELE